jgi:hypothetical protein
MFLKCLSAATCFGYSSLYISWYEQQGKGLQIEDFWVSPIPKDSLNFGLTILIMIFDGIIYAILGWYVKNVFPGRSGAKHPWYFIFTFKFWSNTVIGRLLCRKKTYYNEYYSDSLGKDKKFVKCNF